MRLLWPASAAILLVGGSHASETRTEVMFLVWRAANEAAVAPFEANLKEHGLDRLVPLAELLRTASAWQECRAQPFDVPPKSHWPAVTSTLSLLKELKIQGVLGDFEVHSAYRSKPLNKCAGGAAGSAHLVSFAVDLVPRSDPDAGERLCQFWRQRGSTWNMGLSRYPSGRIHIDTSSYRTWGADHSSGTAFCPGAA